MCPSSRSRLEPPIRLSVAMPVYNERYLVERVIQKVLGFEDPLVREIEIVVVDDGSTDGTRDVLREIAAREPRVRYFEQERNQGKGAALRRAFPECTGELTVIQDADLEYDPNDWRKMLRPFFEADADGVYGSRFAASEYRRVLYFWHTLGNRVITTLSNFATDLNFTDIETCYKMIRTKLLQSIPVRSNDFSIEPEITAKLAKRGAVLYEVPIRYMGRTYAEGKKIGLRHAFTALWAIFKWRVIDDLYHAEGYGAAILGNLSRVQRFNGWMADFLRADVGDRVLEIGAGIGNITRHFLPRSRYLATDVEEDYLDYLEHFAFGRPSLEVARVDLTDAESFEGLDGAFDTVICLNVLEHVEEPVRALEHAAGTLAPDGKLILLVPQGQWLYSSLDRVLDHVKRYDRKTLASEIDEAGFELVSMRQFNKIGVPGWFLNGKLLGRKKFSRVQLKILNFLVPILRRCDWLLPWHGLSLVAVCRIRDGSATPPTSEKGANVAGSQP